MAELQALLDSFVENYNNTRPHRSLKGKTPAQAFRARTKAKPKARPFHIPPHCRVCRDKVNGGNITLRYRSRLYHVAVGRRYEDVRVLVLVADRDVRILKMDGELLRHLTLDPGRGYQPLSS